VLPGAGVHCLKCRLVVIEMCLPGAAAGNNGVVVVNAAAVSCGASFADGQ
jgi:hypothetical protein